jgi:hypothetical protein
MALGLALALAGCWPPAIGRICDVQVDGGPTESSLNAQALECPTRLCLKQVKDPGLAAEPDTGALCTAPCERDSDCDHGETRSARDPGDHRCRRGFVCGVAVQTGSVACCRKVCLCRDFVDVPPTGLRTPAACSTGAASTCPLQPL